MRYTEIFKEAKRLHEMGLALLWLHPRSKRPVENGWTSGPRFSWPELEATYRPGYNLGVRTGEVSKLGKRGFLACIDVDILDEKYRAEALERLAPFTAGLKFPEVQSGSGNGSRHLYCVTPNHFKMVTLAKSDGVTVVNGKKKRHFEIVLYSDGRQMVLPPSVHPSGPLYHWKTFLKKAEELPLFAFEPPAVTVPKAETGSDALDDSEMDFKAVVFDFKPEPVQLEWLTISDDVMLAIRDGKGVLDRSGYLLKATTALLSAGLSQNEVLSVLTDPDTFLGQCAYEHAKTTDRRRAAEWVYRYTVRKVAVERDAGGVFKSAPILEPVLLTEAEQAETAAQFKADRNWRQDLVRGERGVILKLVQNVVTVLANDVRDDVVRRDEFAYRDAYSCDTPWGGKENEIVSDDDVAAIKYWLGKTWGVEPGRDVISDALTVIARESAFDPVRDFLGELPPWDGHKRLDTWLRDHFEAEGDPEYLAQVFRKWMVAMVMRVYEPGAKFDWMPIFEGAQGIGKSSFGRLLVGDKYFLDWLPNLSDKDAALSLQGMWAVEMGELSQFRRNELENIKAFITRTVDKIRPPYGRRLIESPRRCVFFGTTNRKTYLSDDTGNRRFKPVVVGSLNFRALARDRAQLFAEARHLYMEKEETKGGLELTEDALIYEKKIHAEKMVADDSNAMQEAMEDFIEKVTQKRVDFDLNKFRILELFEGVGGLARWRPENRNLQFASKMLQRLGGRSRKVRGLNVWSLVKIGTPPPTTKSVNDYAEVNFF